MRANRVCSGAGRSWEERRGEVLGSVTEIGRVGRGMLCFRVLCLGVVTAACASFLFAPSAQATHLGDPEGISLDGNRIAFVAGPGEANVVTVSRTNGDYTITDTGLGVGAIPDGDGPGGCSVAGQTATCPAAGVTQTFIEVLDGNDVVNGGPGDDTILGGSGGDNLDGHEGNDTIDSGLGDPLNPPQEFDFAVGGLGFNTLTFFNFRSQLRNNIG